LAAVSALCSSLMAQSGTQAANSGAAEDSPTFRVSTHLAIADVVVTDRHGMLIHGLTAKDFHIFENGEEQTVASFEEHIGSAGAATEAVSGSLPPDTYTNATITKRNDPLFIILLDSLNTALSDQSFAQSQLLKLVQDLPKGSRVAVFRLGSKLSMIQGFTEEAADLTATLRGNGGMPQLGMFFNDANLNAPLNAADLTAGIGGSSAGGGHTMSLQDASEAGIASDIVVYKTIASLKALGIYLSEFPGRKNLVWLAGSFPIDIVPNTQGPGAESSGLAGSPDPFRGNRSYTDAIRDLALLLQSGNIAVYPMDVRGLVGNGLFNPSVGSAGGNSANVQGISKSLAAFANSDGQIHAIMRTIASETGGRAYYNTNDIKGSMVEAFNDGANFYTLSYMPRDQKWDGKFRKIKVQVERADTKLYYREGYYAEEQDKQKNTLPSPDPSMNSAMLRGSPAVSDITFQLKVKPEGGVRTIPVSMPTLKSRDDKTMPHLSGPAVHYSLEYAIRPSEVQFYWSPSKIYRSRLAFSAVAFNADGKMLNANVGAFNTPLNETVYEAVQRDALHIKTGIDLPPGKIYLRVGVHDLTTGKIGAFEIPLVVSAEEKASK
jgi:VWFA-related protein